MVVAFMVAFVATTTPDVDVDDEASKNFPSEAGTLDKLDLDGDYYALSPSDATILASTLDGTLVAINQGNGEILWQLNDEPVVRSPYDPAKPVLPAFLPDPKDGSIYMIGGGLKDPLKKLPFTIPELVAASPCKSSDGILYTGKKVDTWFSVDRFTGSKEGSLTFNGCVAGTDEYTCPNLSPSNFLIGRTEYNIMMYDSRSDGRRWNISFYDYSSNLAGVDVGPDYNMAHFTDSSMGYLVTLDRRTGMVQWQVQIGSPIVAMYRVEGDGIVNVPFTSVSKETLNNLLEQFNAPETKNEVIGETKLYPTLYVGEHDQGLYAMPSLVDEQTLTISPTSNGPLLLAGPSDFQMPSEINLNVISDGHVDDSDPYGIPLKGANKNKESVLLFGYYQVPEHSTIKLSPAMTRLRLTSSSHSGVAFRHNRQVATPPFFTAMAPSVDAAQLKYPVTPRQDHDVEDDNEEEEEEGYDKFIIEQGMDAIKNFNVTFVLSKDVLYFGKELVPLFKVYLGSVENKELKVIVVLLIIGVAVLVRIMQRNASGDKYGSFRMSSSSIGSTSSQLYEVSAHPVELDNGIIKVGNIFFDPTHILGKGCEGTFVYKGRFDNRDVAVKRVLAACFTIADREVELLRESDEHPNVIRYFCMEQDRQFRYIALEYCTATLQDYVSGKYVNRTLDPLTILRQATQGLLHLHNLDIVHRDIKPHNVLISMPGIKGDVRAMISDFGLCKKLKVGRMSFSRRSGVAGTEGWIAPEMMLGNRSTTCAVDIFSLGCVYHYVLSDGQHPFGDSFRRQANILAGEYNMDHMQRSSQFTGKSLIEKMINSEPNLRPDARAVLKHPLFWSKEKVLMFLQEVSDRVDKEDYDSAILAGLERGRADVVRGNWQDVLDDNINDDLRKHRSYNGKAVRDLLRALRNKKHHYQELSPGTKHMYGRMPDQFADYWTSRFPKLLVHTWYAMHCIKTEATMVKYFDKDYDFVQTFHRELLGRDKKSLTSSSTFHSDQELFVPHFAAANKMDDSSPQASSVVSQWEDLNVQNDEDDEDQFVEMSAAAANNIYRHPHHRSYHSPQKKGDSLFAIQGSPEKKSNSPVVRRKVAQLKSQQAEELKPSTWAEAVQNIQPKRRDSDSDHNKVIDCDKENLTPPTEHENKQENGSHVEVETQEEGQNKEEEEEEEERVGPIWILPPAAEENNKKKKKNKNKNKNKRPTKV